MTDREALLRAVAANPDDDTPRLIYADHLDELGGAANVARARFIRLQIELTREDNRWWFWKADRLSEVSQLAGRYASEWVKELPNWVVAELLGQKPGVSDFGRGFLESVPVPPHMFAKQGDQLLDVAPIHRIQVRLKRRDRDILPFFASRFLERIRGLTLDCDGGGDLIAKYASTTRTLFALEELDYPDSGLTDVGAAYLARAIDLRKLRRLSLARSQLTASGSGLLTGHPKTGLDLGRGSGLSISGMTRKPYPTDLTDTQWERLEPMLPRPKSGTKKAGGRR
ncbi:MAG: TIGR02996 domain-containing protein [Gemmataceae bacterium]